MNFEKVTALIDRLVPGGLAELARRDAAAIHERRKDAARQFAEADSNVAKALDSIVTQIERANADVAKKVEALRQAEEKRTSFNRERQILLAQQSEARLACERVMRETLPAALFDEFKKRIEHLLTEAVADERVIEYRSSLGRTRHVRVFGDPTARRLGLFALRQAITDSWHRLPLSDAEFRAKFDEAIEGLPAVAPPPTDEEFIARANSAA
jgi:hypothetical protein